MVTGQQPPEYFPLVWHSKVDIPEITDMSQSQAPSQLPLQPRELLYPISNYRQINCYANAFFQCLFATPTFVDQLKAAPINPQSRYAGKIAAELKALVDTYHNGLNINVDEKVPPRPLARRTELARFALQKALRRRYYNKFEGADVQEQDIHEFLIHLLNVLHEELKRPIERKQQAVIDNFKGGKPD